MTDADEKRTMKDVDHTHPHDDTSAGDLFLRGPIVAADGGSDPNRERSTETMKDVDHTPPNGEEGANRVFERGEEFDEDGTVVEE